MAVEIKFLANLVGFLKGTKDMGAALDDVGDSLDDVARDAQRAGDDVGDGLADGTRDAERSVDRLERSVARSFTDMSRDSRKAGDDIGDNVKRGTRRAEEGVEELGDEAKSTARESAASFDGSAESIVDAFQEIAANAFGGFGPAGMVAGLAVAAGIGLGVAGFQAVDEAAKLSQERASEWADAFVEAGGRVLSSEQTLAMARGILTDPERYKELADNAREWGVSESVALLAMSGNTDALREATEGLAEKRQELLDIPIDERTSEAALTLANDIRNGAEALDALNGEMAAGASQADVFSSALRLTAENTEGATVKVDEFGDRVYTLPDGKQIYVDAQTRQATDNVDAIEKRIYGLPTSKTIALRVDRAEFDRVIEGMQGTTVHLRLNASGQMGRFVQ